MGTKRRTTAPLIAPSSLFVLLAVVGGCNSLFGIEQGSPRPTCADPTQLLIDDMEDGDPSICRMGGRNGAWYVVTDGTTGNVTASEKVIAHIPSARGTSRYAAHFEGSGFSEWGPILGLDLNFADLAAGTYNASTASGIRFWLKSTTPLTAMLLIPETIETANGGDCRSATSSIDCNNHFGFKITSPVAEWTQVEIPFLALSQRAGGTALWDPTVLVGIQFLVETGEAFDVWIDDLSFYRCDGGNPNCLPTCLDPELPKQCAPREMSLATCVPEGTDCNLRTTWCADAMTIDDMEDGNTQICATDRRAGGWWAASDGTATAKLTNQAIPNGRAESRRAVHLTGAGFKSWGALMGADLRFLGRRMTYDATSVDGITFFMKSVTPVSVGFLMPETAPTDDGSGTCTDETECNVHYSFGLGSSGGEWVSVRVPFSATSRTRVDANGNFALNSIPWDASRLTAIQFAPRGSDVDLWIDDVHFYACSGDDCAPTCLDPRLPVPCVASGATPAGCWPAGTICGGEARIFNAASIWSAGTDDVWTVGYDFPGYDGAISRRDGTGWTAPPRDGVPPLWSVHGSGPAEAWAVGDRGATMHWDGTTWSMVGSPTNVGLNTVRVNGPDDAWAVGFRGVILHWDGTAWSTSPSGTTEILWGVGGSGPRDMWAVGDAGTILHWTGAGWSRAPSGTQTSLNAVWSAGPDDTWIVADEGLILRWNGTAWSPVPSATETPIWSVWGSAADDIWAVGPVPTILRWNGSTWSPVPSPTTAPLFSVSGSGPNDVWIAGDDTILHWTGDGWR